MFIESYWRTEYWSMRSDVMASDVTRTVDPPMPLRAATPYTRLEVASSMKKIHTHAPSVQDIPMT